MAGVAAALLLWLSAGVLLGGSRQQPGAALSAENESFRAVLVSSHGYPDFEAVVKIENKRTPAEAELSLQIRTRSVELFQIVGDNRLLVGGTLPRGGAAFAVVSMPEALLEASFWSYQYALSPDGRLLLLQSHYPRMGIAGSRRSILTLYDFTAAKEANILPGANTVYTFEAGRPVYPPWNFANRSYERFRRPNNLYNSPFLWSEDGKRVAFVSFSEEQGEYFLVLIEPMDRYEDIQILRKPVRLRDFAESPERIPLSESSRERIVFYVRELRWKDSEHVEAKTERRWLPEWIELTLPKKPQK